MDLDYKKLVQDVVLLAREAGELILKTGPVEISFKGAVNLVTQADRMSEAMLVEGLGRLLPQASILAEEGAARSESTDLLWVVDPLDGTTNFAHGYPVYGVAIALVENRKPVLGVVYDPTRDECFWAVRNHGAFLNEHPLHVSPEKGLGEALLATGFPYDMWTTDRDNLTQFRAFAKLSRGLRRGGSAALDLCYVAAGRLDGFWEEKLAPWDLLAGVLLVEEARGRVTGYLGDPVDAWQGHVVAAQASLQGKMVHVLADIESQGILGPLGR